MLGFILPSPMKIGSKSRFSIAYFRRVGKHWTKTGRSFEKVKAESLENTGFSNESQKNQKFLKKSVDKKTGTWYYVQARLRATNLENDTE